MRFHCLLPLRDEADIVGQCLRQLLTWADAIYVFDTGSVDATWEIVLDLAAKEKRIIPLKKEAVYFSDTVVRGWVFDQVRKHMRDGDWFLRVDADEFYQVPPPEFVKTCLGRHETVAWYQVYDFRLRASEALDWESGKESLKDRERPIELRRQWYTPREYSEPRLCRYRESMRWPATHSFPYNAGFVAAERLPIRHYPHRDPQQLQRRTRLRAIMMANYHEWADLSVHHWVETEWQKFITPDDLPELRHWQPGQDFPDFGYKTHLKPAPVRLIQRGVHAFCLPLFDPFRPGWREMDAPPAIPESIALRLQKEIQ